MAFSKNYSFSAQTFLKFYDSLATATHDARQIANDLYSRNVIERKCLHRISRKENERPSQWLAKELFLATHEVLCVTPSKFPNVLEALRCDSSLNPLCDQMEQTQVSLGIPRLQTVVCELQEMCGWALLGLCFGFPRRSLMELARESEELSKISLVSSWLSREKDASWKTLISALCNVHRKHLAVRVAVKYGLDCAEFITSENKLAELTHGELGSAIDLLLQEMKETDKKLLQVEEDVQQSMKELQALQRQVDELQHGNISLQQCNSELMCKVLSIQIKLSEARGVTSNATVSSPDSNLKSLQECMLQSQGQLESLRHNSSDNRLLVGRLTTTVEATSGKLHDLMQHKLELMKIMRQCERSMNSHLLQDYGEETSQKRTLTLSATEIHHVLVKMELESHEQKLEELEASKTSIMKSIDRLDQNILATNQEQRAVGQPSVDALYNSAIHKHGTDNCLFYMEVCMLQQRLQLALMELESCVCESKMYPLVQEMSNLKTDVWSEESKKKSRSEPILNATDVRELDDSFESREATGSSPTDAHLNGRTFRLPSESLGFVSEENQYISMKQCQTKQLLSPQLPPRTSQNGKKLFSLHRFSPTKRKLKAASKKVTKSESAVPHVDQVKYNTISYRGHKVNATTVTSSSTVEDQPWYAPVSRDIAEYRLKHCNKDGAYLVRPSSTSKGKFVLSLLYGGRITHARIEKISTGKYTVGDEDDADFDNVTDLVGHYQAVPFVVCGSTTLKYAC